METVGSAALVKDKEYLRQLSNGFSIVLKFGLQYDKMISPAYLYSQTQNQHSQP